MKAICTQRTAPHRTSMRLAVVPRVRSSTGSVSAVEIAIVIAIVVLLILGVATGANTPREHVAAVRTIRVEAGQTLWSIARSNPVPGLTTQQTVELIARTNGLGDDRVAALESLRVPVATSNRLVAQR